MPENCPIEDTVSLCYGCRYYEEDYKACSYYFPSILLEDMLTLSEKQMRGLVIPEQPPKQKYTIGRVNELEDKLNKHIDKTLKKKDGLWING